MSGVYNGKHWLEVGQELLAELRNLSDSGDISESDVLAECATRYGKSIHTLRKVIDATTWVKGFYPHLLEEPPERFPMTQALQLRTIHRLDPSQANTMAEDVFAGKTSRQQLANLVDTLSGQYRVPSKRSHFNWYQEAKKQRAIELEHRVEQQLNQWREEGRFAANSEIRRGRKAIPPCDFFVSRAEHPDIAVEVKNFALKEPDKAVMALLGSCALWQAQGFETWLFFPKEAEERVQKIQSMAETCQIDPPQVFLLGDDGSVSWDVGSSDN